ncbi:sporulation protein [Dactylosporangium sp. AC04546]|uniref:sporulation protein n=1 Tax=Dactylosporangium sp. AC04546 TaxID=2862460 RepID=UPI001EDD931A|nr:sporulation protein [Dactylosporangium sp. AC04546]WVK89687.1 sporulation protein [Dactylosporangium sp. AC04546]
MSMVVAELHEPCVRPGTMAPGRLHVVAGARVVDVEKAVLGVATGTGSTVIRHQVAGRFGLPARRSRSIPFLLPIPWETPVSWPEAPAVLTLRTRVAVAGGPAVDTAADLEVHPTLAHHRLVRAVTAAGFGLLRSGLAFTPLPGVRRSMPYFQDLTFQSHRPSGGGVRVAVVANPVGLDAVVTAAGRRRLVAVRHDDEQAALRRLTEWLRFAVAAEWQLQRCRVRT